jgi:hypothetical protein
MRGLRAALAAVLAAAGLAAGLAVSAQPAAATGCTPGGISHHAVYGPPGKVTVWFSSASNPARCAWVRPEAQSNDGHDTFGSKVRGVNINSTATVYNGSTLAKGWQILWTTVSCWKKRIYPTVGKWYISSGSCG